MPETDSYRIEIDGEWTLNDLHEFPYAYTQAYSFLYSLMVEEAIEDERLRFTFVAHPWRGGYSAVNFFHYLYDLIPASKRPNVISIQYSSPGWIELSLVLAVGLALKRIVNNICDAALKVNHTYNEIYKGLQRRRLLSLESQSAELQLDREHLAFVEESATTFARILGFESLQELNNLAPNKLAALKMMLAFYRRARKLKEYEDDKKLKL